MKNIQFPIFVGICHLVTVQVFGSCPSMFVQLSSGKYYFSPIKASWIDSWRFCRHLGANLISIETPDEQQALVEHIKPRAALVNLARNKAAYQSSTYRSSDGASHAVDGAGFGCDCHGDCSHSESENTPWWQVDLGNDYKVYIVSLGNRVRAPDRLHDFEVRIGDKPAPDHGSNTLCGRHVGAGIAGGAIHNVTCEPGPITGRYVTVQITKGSENYLTLCEVLVLGETAVQTTEATTTAVSYWTSGIKMFQDKKWIWMSTGNDIAYHAWCEDQPNNYLDGQDCLQFNLEEDGCWNDFNCSSDNLPQQDIRFICEVDNMIH